jgi:oxygen-independent coproporphyrinogen-3 oxidase
LAEVKIWYESEEKPEGSFDADFSVDYTDTRVSISFGLTEEASEKYGVSSCRKDGENTSIRIGDGDLLLTDRLCMEAPIGNWEDRVATKNDVKRLVYQHLHALTGQVLPWGDLTGIRPTKIAMQMLESGMTDAQIREELHTVYCVGEAKTELALSTVHREKKLIDGLHAKKGYSLYVGIPFCPTICLYCSFGSHRLDKFCDMVQPYFQALYREIRFIAEQMKGWHLDSLYIGGGTPTSVSAEQLRELLEELDRNFDLESLAEFTVEAGRPDTITEDKLRVMKEFPVTRISINPQTMNQKTLDIIGRHHSVEQTEEVFAMARRLGFDNINMDMIVGLPGEGAAEVQETLDRIRRLDPDSLTVHSLALKRATRLNLFRDNYEPISFENSEAIMQAAAKCAEDMGMSPYYLYRQKNMAGNFENVGFAKPRKAGLYNILIMEEAQCILACGASGSTKIVYGDGRIERIENVKDVRSYLERIDEMIARKDRIKE